MRRLACLGLLVCLTLLPPVRPVLAQQNPYPRIPGEVMSFLGADWLEREARPTQDRPELIFDALGLKQGDVVADVGCGTGYLARRLVARVLPGGKVYCNDIQAEMLELMKQVAAQEGVTGIEPILGTVDDAKLPAGKVDWILLVDVYHEMSRPQRMLANMAVALAPAGRIGLLEYRLEDGTGDLIKADHTMSVRQVMAEWKPAGYELIDLQEGLPRQHLFIFRPGGRGSSADVVEDYDLFDAIAQKKVEVQTIGAGNDRVTIRIRRTTNRRMVITAPVGVYFKASGNTRDMIARRDSAITLFDDSEKNWTVRAVGRQEDKPEATGADRFEILSPGVAPRYAELMRVIQEGTYQIGNSPILYMPRSFKLEQTAVWIAEHDLPYYELAPFAHEPRVPAPYSVAFALVLLDQAGVDVTARRVWKDREDVFGPLKDRGLTLWYGYMTAPVYPVVPFVPVR